MRKKGRKRKNVERRRQREKPSTRQAPESGISRRKFLLIAGAAAGTALAVHGVLKLGDSKKETSKDSDKSNLDNMDNENIEIVKPPEVTYVPHKEKEKPLIAKELAEDEIIRIANKIDAHIQYIIGRNKDRIESGTITTKEILVMMGEIFVRADTEYERYIPGFTRSMLDPERAIRIINQFLDYIDKHFYAHFKLTRRPTVNYYSVREHNDVFIEGEKIGEQRTIYNGAAKYPRSRLMGKVDDVDQNQFVVWEDHAKGFYKRNQSVFPRHDSVIPKDEFIADILKSTKYHEAIHLYIHNRFPGLSAARNNAKEPSLLREAAQIDELCGLGAELSQGQSLSATIALLDVENVGHYRLAQDTLVSRILEYIRKDIKAGKIGYEESDLIRDPKGVANWYIRQQKNVNLVNRIGLEMYSKGIRLAEAFEKKVTRVD